MFSIKKLRSIPLRSIPPRKNLRWLAWTFVPLLVFAVSSAIALVHPTAAWTSLAISAGTVVPLGMIVAACYGNAACRPFRAGFAIAAGSYFIFFTLFPENSWQDNFPTSQALGFCYTKLFPGSQANPVAAWSGPYGGFGGGGFGGGGFGGGGFGGGGFGGGGFGGGGFGGGGFGGGGAFFVADDDDSSKDSGDSDPNVNPFGVRANSSYGSTSNPTGPIANTAATQAYQKQQDELVAAHNFWIIGHSIWALIFGWIGGVGPNFLRGEGKEA